MSADVGQAAVAGPSASLGTIHGHVSSSSQHVPWTIVAHHWGSQIWVAVTTVAAMVEVVALGGVDQAVGVSGASWRPAGRRITSLPVPAK